MVFASRKDTFELEMKEKEQDNLPPPGPKRRTFGTNPLYSARKLSKREKTKHGSVTSPIDTHKSLASHKMNVCLVNNKIRFQ